VQFTSVLEVEQKAEQLTYVMDILRFLEMN